MSPCDVTPYGSIRIPLVEEMVVALVEHESIRVIHPILGRLKVETSPVRLWVRDLCIEGREESAIAVEVMGSRGHCEEAAKPQDRQGDGHGGACLSPILQ